MATYEFTLTDYQHPCPGVSPESQVWLNRGFIWMFAFGHEEAIRCFEKALDADPANLMAMWGVAICQSPNYNNPEMDEAQSKKAVEFIGKMRKAIAKGGHGDADVGMATALMSRFGGWPADKDDRARLDKAYADEMRKVAAAHPSDPDVLCITAEAIMQCNPWKLWVNGVAIAEVPELTSLLETGLKIAPNHPGLCHFYIHLLEMSPNPGACLPVADRLRTLVPDAGHLVHMPSHIDVLVGHYAEAIKSNEDAVIVDRKYKALRGGGDFYTLYRMHDLHLLVYASMFAGNEAKALAAANEMADELTPSVLEGEMADWLETFAAVPWHVLVRFGRWDTILAKPLPTDPTLYAATTTLGLYARTLALAALCRVDDAVAERDKFRAAKERLPSSRMLFNNSAVDMAAIADKMVDGELAYRQEDYETAFTALREAVALDDGLIYDEPWGWMQPARHALGALLMEQGRRDEAERVYRADLQWPRHPRNVWALHGLAECLRTGPASPEASKEYNEIKAILEEQQRGADVEIKASCFCRLSALKE